MEFGTLGHELADNHAQMTETGRTSREIPANHDAWNASQLTHFYNYISSKKEKQEEYEETRQKKAHFSGETVLLVVKSIKVINRTQKYQLNVCNFYDPRNFKFE